MKSILVFRIGQLGDSLVALPSVWAVREAFPQARLTLLCDFHPGKPYVLGADLFGGAGLFDSYETYPVRSGKQGRLLRPLDFAALLKRLRRQKYDALVYLAPSGRTSTQVRRDYLFFKAAGIKHFFGMEGTAISDAINVRPLQRVEHEADHLLARLASSGIPTPPAGRGMTDLNLSGKEDHEFQAWLNNLPSDGQKPWVGFGPGSKMPAKKWPLQRYSEVGSALIEKYDIWPVVFGGPEDLGVGNELLSAWKRGYNAAGRLSLRGAAAALKRCGLYVGNDTGTMHLAASAGTKCVAIFSARDLPGRWDPYGSGHKVLRASIECEGCRLIECLERKNACLDQVMTGDVIAACDELLISASFENSKAAGL